MLFSLDFVCESVYINTDNDTIMKPAPGFAKRSALFFQRGRKQGFSAGTATVSSVLPCLTVQEFSSSFIFARMPVQSDICLKPKRCDNPKTQTSNTPTKRIKNEINIDSKCSHVYLRLHGKRDDKWLCPNRGRLYGAQHQHLGVAGSKFCSRHSNE